MSDLNDKLRAALKSAFLAHGSSGPKYDSAKLAEAIEAIIATPAPQAAPSDDLHIETGLRLRLVCEKLALSKAVPEDPAEIWAVAFSVLGMVRHEIENLQRAAAPAVAITQAATSEPVAWIFDDLEILLETDSEIQYGLRKRSEGRPLVYAGAAPVAHLSGTTPNTEVPSVMTWWERIQQTIYAGKSREDLPLTAIIRHAENEIADLRAALSAQQAGVQEAPSGKIETDLSRELREHNDPRLYREADVLMSRAAAEIENCRWIVKQVCKQAAESRAALAAATQTEKKP